MTRRRRHGASTVGKTEVFEKTKMCKFHILGVCMKGDGCRFAHEKNQLQALPDLQRTKLCKTLINTGQCDNPQCKYAHNKEELRPLPEVDLAEQQAKPQLIPGLASGSHAAVPAGPITTTAQTAQAAQEAAALFRPGGPLAQFGQPLQDMPMSQKQAAIQQMGQVAQAHAAEAARLHAMAMFLHAHSNGQMPPGSVPDQATLNQFLSQAGAGQLAEKSSAGDAQGGDGQGCSTKSRSDTNYARVGLGQSANSADDTSLAETMSRVLPNEPVHINPRNLSCNSLKSLGGLDDKEELPGDMDDARSPATDAKHVLTYASGSGQSPSPRERRNRDADLDQAFTSVKDVMTVKNTFLDFGPHTPAAHALRSVQTASGRLDLMYADRDD
jgi:hypothetical protein